ncbi:MAG: hypothetical protein ACKVS5_14415 [Parvularculaceae bacterium]
MQKIFRDHGVKYVAELGRLAAAGQPLDLAPFVADDDAERASQATAPPAVPAIAPEEARLPAAVRERLAALVSRLERAQRALDDAVVAIEAIEVADSA